MKLYDEIYELEDFTAWGEAKHTYDKIIEAGLGEQFIQSLEDIYPDGVTESQLNDLLWFEEEWCYELVELNKWGVEPVDGASVVSDSTTIAEAIESRVEEYIYNNRKMNGEEYTKSDFDEIDDIDFEESIDEWLEDNQGEETDSTQLAENWLEDVGYKEIDEAIENAVAE